jgi:hypothetical protein
MILRIPLFAEYGSFPLRKGERVELLPLRRGESRYCGKRGLGLSFRPNVSVSGGIFTNSMY